MLRATVKQVLRQMRVRGVPPPGLTEDIETAVRECARIFTPRRVIRRFGWNGCEFSNGYAPRGNDILRHLSACESVYLFAATLGDMPDRECSRLMEQGSSYKAFMTDSIAAVMIENYCDDECAALAVRESGTFTARFSCGYGDLPLGEQKEICRMLDTPRTIGVHLSESGLLMPQKSVTAFIGRKNEGNGVIMKTCGNKCSACDKKDSVYRAGGDE